MILLLVHFLKYFWVILCLFIRLKVEGGCMEVLVFSGNSPERPFTDKITR